jgi:hypothetical protein
VTSARAREAWDTLIQTFCRPGANGALEVWEGRTAGRAPLWPVSQVLAAAVDVGAMTGDPTDAEALVRGLRSFRRGGAYAPRPRLRRRYFDDNAWIGIELCRLSSLTGDPAHLAHARRVFDFVATGQDPDGGVRWVEGRTSRNACATAPASELALQIHLRERDDALPAFARRAMGWLDRTLRLPSGLFADRQDRGRIEPTVWSYNQGAALGAFALLYRAEGNATDLDAAVALARVSLEHFRGEVLWSHPPVFNAVWFRNLLELNVLTPVPGLADALGSYLDRVWEEARDTRSGLFTGGGIGTYDGTPAIDHAGLIQLFTTQST